MDIEDLVESLEKHADELADILFEKNDTDSVVKLENLKELLLGQFQNYLDK